MRSKDDPRVREAMSYIEAVVSEDAEAGGFKIRELAETNFRMLPDAKLDEVLADLRTKVN